MLKSKGIFADEVEGHLSTSHMGNLSRISTFGMGVQSSYRNSAPHW